jgi:hypothetical protein
MQIHIDAKNRVFHLQNEKLSYIMKAYGGGQRGAR